MHPVPEATVIYREAPFLPSKTRQTFALAFFYWRCRMPTFVLLSPHLNHHACLPPL